MKSNALKLGRVLLLLTMVSVTGCEPDPQADTLPDPGTEAMSVFVDRSETRLRDIEGNMQKMVSARIIPAAANDLFEDAAGDYAMAMQTAFAAMRRDANAAGQTEGREGDAKNVGQFETAAQNHQGRWMTIAGQAEMVMGRVQRGEAQLERAILGRMTEEQRDEFRAWLAPEGERLMMQQHPDLFPRLSVGMRLRRSVRAGRAVLAAVRTDLGQRPVFSMIGRAEASAVLPCVGSCVSQNWGACLVCVAGAVPRVLEAVNNFRSCWKNASWWGPKALCVLKLVFVLA